MKRILTVCLLSLLLAASLALPTLASSGGVHILDRAELLSSAEESAISACADLRHGTEFYLVTSRAPMSSSSVRSLLELEDGASAVILVIDTSGGQYYYEMFVYGHANAVISRRASDAILDDGTLYSAIKGGRLGDGAVRFFTLTADRIHADWFNPGERFGGIGVTVAVGIIVALLAGGGTALGVFLAYRRKLHGTSYPLDRYASLQLTYSDDRFVGSSVTRVRIQRASSSGGGGGSGGGGSRGRR